MKWISLLSLFIVFSCSDDRVAIKKCPANIVERMQTCEATKCVKNDQPLLKGIVKKEQKQKYKTLLTINKAKKNCQITYKSTWNAQQTCNFPLKNLSNIVKAIGDFQGTEGLEMYQALKKIAQVKNRDEYYTASVEFQGVKNKMMSRRLELETFQKKYPELAGNINKYCTQRKYKDNSKKSKIKKEILSKVEEDMPKLRKEVEKQMKKYRL